MRRIHRETNVPNGPAAFAQSNGIRFEGAQTRRAEFSAAGKAKWGSTEKKRNKEESLGRLTFRKSLLTYPTLSHLRSFGRKRIVNYEDIRRLFHGTMSKLFRKWIRDGIHKWEATMGGPVPQHLPSVECISMIETTYVPNDWRGPFVGAVGILLRGMAPIRESVRHFYTEFNGKNEPLAMALVRDGAPMWFEVGLIMGKPERILCVPLAILEYWPKVGGPLGAYGPPESASLKIQACHVMNSLFLLDIFAREKKGFLNI